MAPQFDDSCSTTEGLIDICCLAYICCFCIVVFQYIDSMIMMLGGQEVPILMLCPVAVGFAGRHGVPASMWKSWVWEWFSSR